MKKLSTVALILSLTWTGITSAATFYVSTNGSDDSGNGAALKPWKTIGHGINQLSGGDTLIVKNGIYYDKQNFINSRLSNIPNGNLQNPTIIQAEEPMKVRIKNTSSLTYYDNMLLLEGNYIRVDGFIYDMTNTNYPSYNGAIEGSYNKVTRSIFKREGDVDEYGGWLQVRGDYNLIEDCAGVGGARYGFITGSSTIDVTHNIFRRCVGRVDYANSPQPKATFAVYGNNSGHGVHDMLFQNIIVIDGRQQGPSSGELTYGGFYFPKNAAEVTIQGSIMLNNLAAHSGYYLKEQSGRNIKIEHSIAWDIYGSNNISGIRAEGSNGPLTIDHVTVGGSPTGYYNGSSDTEILTNSLFYNNDVISTRNYGWNTQTNNAFNLASQSEGTNAVTNNVTLQSIVRPDVNSGLYKAATDGSNIGADVTVQYGITGTLWGEPGFNQRTEIPLWPWPYENIIKEVFAETNTPSSDSYPATNPTVRGFTVDTDQFGKTMTLTRYIWQYLGNEIPSDIYTLPPQQDAPSMRLLN